MEERDWWFFPYIRLMEVEVVIIFLFLIVGVELSVKEGGLPL